MRLWRALTFRYAHARQGCRMPPCHSFLSAPLQGAFGAPSGSGETLRAGLFTATERISDPLAHE